MKNFTDEQLVTNYLLKGNQESLEILIKRYLKPIFSFVFRFLREKQDAEDVTQEVFIKVWKNLKKFDRKKSFKTWIFTIAKNTCLDWQRKNKKQPIYLAKTFNEPTYFFDDSLEKILKELSPEYRLVLILRYNDHLKFKEIAEILEKPLNTVKSYHRRALFLLKNYLKEKDFYQSRGI